jgi:hypothetical protein
MNHLKLDTTAFDVDNRRAKPVIARYAHEKRLGFGDRCGYGGDSAFT